MTELVWRPLSFDPDGSVTERIERVLTSWEGTRYMDGQQQKGLFVDCINFVAGVYDELRGKRRGRVRTIPSDQSLHNREGCLAAMRFLIDHCEADVVRKADGPLAVEPLDGIVVGTTGPGHVLLVGAQNRLWHATREGVRWSGMSVQERVWAVARPRRKEVWL